MSNANPLILISVIGESKASPENMKYATEVGALLAESGAVVVCGGMTGVMEAVCKGAKSKGGATIGILPGSTIEDSNKWVDYPICTGIGDARNAIVVQAGQSVIAIGGSYGTLSEIGHALSFKKRLVGLNTWDLPSSRLRPQDMIICETAAEAVDAALKI
tara:strand:- start:50 stop:529 length:480 start_codon:yes stop_codon:yes gene_type:complete